MNFDLDLAIFSGFLIVNLLVGLSYSRGVTNISEYAIGNRNFSTATIVATLVATWCGAGFFSYTLIETYRQGIAFLIPALGDSLVFLVIGYVLAPRMGEFLGKLSIAEAMGDLFGSKARLVTVVAGIISSIGILGVQFKVSSKILELIFNTSGTYATILSATIVILYSAFGGIRAVTFTDIIQFFTFGCIIPIIATIAWEALSDHGSVIRTIETSPLFDYSDLLDFTNIKLYKMLSLMAFFLIPEFGPMIFQRVSMASSTAQVARSFKLAGLICLVIQLVIAALGVFVLSDNPNLDPDNLISYIINHYTYSGFKGMIAVGIMSMIMSSADSLISSMSVIFAHDLCKPLGFKWTNNELLVSRIFAVISGACAIYFALKLQSILELMMLAWGLYVPIVTPAFLLAIFGFRSSGKSVLIGMFAAAATVTTWKIYLSHIDLDSFIPGIVANVIFLFTSHYLLKQPGGWVGIKDQKTFSTFQQEKKRRRQNLINAILGFNFLQFCRNNAPNNETTCSYFGFFSIASISMAMYTIPQDTMHQYATIVQFLYRSILILSCYFLICPIWPNNLKNPTLTSLAWITGAMYTLVCSASILALISNFAQTQLMIFFINVIVISIIFRWQAALFMIVCGVLCSIVFIKYYAGVQVIEAAISMKVKITYCLLLLSSILIAFLKPIQDSADKKLKLFEEAEKQISDMSEQMLNLLIMRQEFINNINHEIRTPIHQIGSSVSTIRNDWDKCSEEQQKECAEIIYQGYQRIKEHMNNILDLSDLSTNKIKLTYQYINFQELTEKVLEESKALYLTDNVHLQINLNILADDLIVACDEEKMWQALRHLIKNAISYTPKGMIEITLSNRMLVVNDNNVEGIEFAISDEGIGVPAHEISHIFGPFIQSSYTKKISGGKGLGLSLCERIIQMHKGTIWAQNNIDKPGATFQFIIPL
jgi:Na+/proline symporter/signal transduction histidine kinase